MPVLAFMNRPKSAGRKVCPGSTSNKQNENKYHTSNGQQYLGVNLGVHNRVVYNTSHVQKNDSNKRINEYHYGSGNNNVQSNLSDTKWENQVKNVTDSQTYLRQKYRTSSSSTQRPKSAVSRSNPPQPLSRPKSAATRRSNVDVSKGHEYNSSNTRRAAASNSSNQETSKRFAWDHQERQYNTFYQRHQQNENHQYHSNSYNYNARANKTRPKSSTRPASAQTSSTKTNTTPVQKSSSSSNKDTQAIRDFYAPEGTIRDDTRSHGKDFDDSYRGFTYDSPQRREHFLNVIRHIKSRLHNMEVSGRRMHYPVHLCRAAEELCPPKERYYLQNILLNESLDGRSTTDFYVFGKVLGQGSFAKVRVAWHKLTGRQVAIKTYEKAKLKDANQWRRIQQEIRLMEKLNNSRVIRMFECIESPKRIHIVMEFLGGNNLCSYVKSKRRLCEDEAKEIFSQLINSVDYIHGMNVIHRDIKLENVIFDENKVTKLVDFGFGVFNRDKKLHVFCGTPSYMAPEIVKRKDYHGKAVDIWSLGIVLYALLVGRFPFCAKTYPELYKKIAKGVFQIPEDLSPEARDLIQNILVVDVEKRFTLRKIKDHPWMQKANLEKPKVEIRSKYNIHISKNPRNDLNETVLKKLDNFGVRRDIIIRNVLQKRRNSITTCYYLLKLDMEISGKIGPSKSLEDSSRTATAELSEKSSLNFSRHSSDIQFTLDNKSVDITEI